MKILYLAHRIPYPPNKGDKIRSFNEIKYLSQKNEVDLICLADDKKDLVYVKELEKICGKVSVFFLDKKTALLRGFLSLLKNRPISAGYFYLSGVQNVFDKWIKESDYDAVLCFCSPMAEYVFRCGYQKKLKDIHLAMDFCDLDSDKWNQYSKNSSFIKKRIYKKESKLLSEYEKKVNKFFDNSFFVSSPEAELFKSKFPECKNVYSIPNGVDYDFFSFDKKRENVYLKKNAFSPVMVFTGAMDYYANIDAVLWFAKKIFPAIKEKYPDSIFCIAGSNPSDEVSELEKSNGIIVTGFVEDIRPYYQHADISVIPLRIARGIQNKVLEAMSMGKAVVSTTKALEGINATKNEVFNADFEDEFAQKIMELFENMELREKTGKNARNFVEKNFSWKVSMSDLERKLSAGKKYDKK
jgi:sugar transferase (PEP-CTERM/EpsH1 system associated)